MDFEILLTISVFIGFLTVVVTGKVPIDMALASAMVILIIGEVITPSEALGGFSNPAIFIIACFYIVSTAMRESGALNLLLGQWLGNKIPYGLMMPRLMGPVALISSIMSNTPVVAMLIPYLRDWSKKTRVPLSKLLIPLSFASILGGVCTLIGTSTNIIVVGLLDSYNVAGDLSLFSPAIVGLPIIFLGIAYFAILGHRLLPDIPLSEQDEQFLETKKYAVRMKVQSNGALIGKTLASSGLLKLNHGLLSEIRSNGKTITSIRANRTLKNQDILIFVGQPETITELRQIEGLITIDNQLSKLDVPQSSRSLVEAILAPESLLIGKTIKRSMFRTRYGSVIVSVSRGGRQIKQELAKIRLKAGDLLLLEAPDGFVRLYRNSRDFLLLSRLDGVFLPDKSKSSIMIFILFAYLVLVISEITSLVAGSLLLVLALGITKCVTLDQAQRSIDGRVLLAIGASISLGTAFQNTGIAESTVLGVMSIAGENPYLNLLVLYIATVIATELITNNAAAVLMFPFAQIMSYQLDVSLIPFAVAIMFGASSSFMTPMGYQTNLMIQEAGQYSFKDFFKVGVGLSFLVGAMVVVFVPLVWPF